MINEESRAQWICCPICDKCDKKKCNRKSDDCDILKTTVGKFVHKSMFDTYTATKSIKPWNILFDTDRYNIRYKVYINGEEMGGFVTLIDDDHYGYYTLFYYNNGSISWKTISNDAKIKLKRIKKSKLPM